MKILLTLISTLIASTTFAAVTPPSEHHTDQKLDKIVAIVNDDVVTRNELNHALAIIKAQAEQAHMQTPSPEKLQKQVLDQLINKKLQLQVAKQAGLALNDKEADQAIARIAKQNGITVSELYSRLSQDGMKKEEYRSEIKDQLTMQKLQQQEVINRINVSQNEINRFLKSKVWQKEVEKEYHIEDILIPLAENSTPEAIQQAKVFAKSVIKELKKGKNVSQVAELSSTYHVQGEDLGFKKLGDLPSAFSLPVSHLESKQEIAGPIQTGNGLHILQLLDLHAVGQQQAAPTKEQVRQILLQRKFGKALENWVSTLRSQAFIVTNPDK